MATPTYYDYISESGIIVADTSTIKAEVEAEYIAAFGADLSLDPSTPQGVLIASETLSRVRLLLTNAAVANQINPNLAGGGFLDAICALTGLKRTKSTPSIIPSVTLTGIPFAIVTAGARAKTAAGDIFQSITSVQFDIIGNAAVDFQSVENGAIPCLASALTIIVDGILGWETVTNPTAAIVGTTTQSDSTLRVLRKNTLAAQGVSTPAAVVAALAQVNGVKSFKFLENYTGASAAFEGITIAAHTVWACVDGGVNADIGLALLLSKSGGCAWKGSTSVVVVEPASLQNYTVLFDRPTPVPIWVRVTIKVINPLVDPTSSVIAAVLAWSANTQSDLGGCVVGGDISPFEIASSISSQVSGLYVQKVEISIDGTSYQTTELVVASGSVATVISGHISVVIA